MTGVLERVRVDDRGSGEDKGGSQGFWNTISRVSFSSVGVLSTGSPVSQDDFVLTV